MKNLFGILKIQIILDSRHLFRPRLIKRLAYADKIQTLKIQL